MTSYHGGKQKIGGEIADEIYTVVRVIEREYDITFKGYCEPFCGMLGVYQHIPALLEDHQPKIKYVAGDANESVIKMWQAAQKGWKPPTRCSEKYFYDLKYSGKTSAVKGFIGHQYSFGGQYFQGYIGKYGRSPVQKTAAKKVNKISKKLYDTNFQAGSYTQFNHLKDYIIYCDPPYAKTECRYVGEDRSARGFDNEQFWEWVRKMSQCNLVLVSEANAPNDFESVWVKKSKSNIKGKKNYNKEQLFIYEEIF